VGAAINVSRPGADPPTRAELSSALGVDREAGQE
jgi:fructokinase